MDDDDDDDDNFVIVEEFTRLFFLSSNNPQRGKGESERDENEGIKFTLWLTHKKRKG